MATSWFQGCSDKATYRRRIIDLESELSPREMREVWKEKESLPQELASYIAHSVGLMESGANYDRPYARRIISDNIQLFSANEHSCSKYIIVCFCGGLNRMMIPTPIFLQFMPEADCDILMIKDPSRSGFLCGVPGFGRDLSEVAENIEARLDLGRYAAVKCLGVSGGGSAALYAGIMLDAERALSICGKHRSLKLASGGDARIAPFSGEEFDEMVREKVHSTRTRLILAFGSKSPKDIEGAQSLKSRLPSAELVGVDPFDNHNVLFCLLKGGTLGAFFERFLFGSEPAPAPGRIG
jgi:hypothetical protein